MQLVTVIDRKTYEVKDQYYTDGPGVSDKAFEELARVLGNGYLKRKMEGRNNSGQAVTNI